MPRRRARRNAYLRDPGAAVSVRAARRIARRARGRWRTTGCVAADVDRHEAGDARGTRVPAVVADVVGRRSRPRRSFPDRRRIRAPGVENGAQELRRPPEAMSTSPSCFAVGEERGHARRRRARSAPTTSQPLRTVRPPRRRCSVEDFLQDRPVDDAARRRRGAVVERRQRRSRTTRSKCRPSARSSGRRSRCRGPGRVDRWPCVPG